MTPASVVIVGGGLGGFTTAQELRKLGFTGGVTIVDPEGVPYDRPPLSKEYLAGTTDAAALRFAPESWFAENDVELVTDRVVALDPDGPLVRLAGGGTLTADAVVLALGGRARHLSVPGGDDPGLHVLRTTADADALRAELQPGRRIAIIGAGLIGAETAATARALGADVTLIDPVEIPGVPAMGSTLATVLHDMHAAHGVEVLTGMTTAIERDGERWRVVLDEGTKHGGHDVEADAVLVAIGIIPEVDLAVEAGLDVDNGVLVDAEQRTSHPAIYAVGDGSRTRLADGTLTHRHEHWDSALQGAQRAAAAIAGAEAPVPSAPWMWSDRYDVHVEAVGTMVGEGLAVTREIDGRPAMVFRLDADHRVLGACALNPKTAIRAVRRMIDRGTVVDPAQLADPSVDLKKLAK